MLLLLAPLVGVLLSLSFAEFPAQRRFLVAACSLAMAGGAVAALVRAAAHEGVAWRGFTSDAFSALLVVGAVAASLAGIARAGSGRRSAAAEAALFAATAAGVLPLLVDGAHLLAITLPLATLGFATSTLVVGRGGGTSMRAWRALAGLAASDVAALVAIGSVVSSGTRLPPELSMPFAAAMLAAAFVRLGFVPGGWSSDDAIRADPLLGALWLGPVRAQGVLLLLFAVGSHRGFAYAAAAAAAATAAVSAIRAMDRSHLGSRIGPLSAVGASLAIVGLSIGGPTATWGAALCIAATFAVIPAWMAGGVWRDGARLSLGVLPAGSLLPGAVLVVAATFEAAAVRPAFLVFAVPSAAATLAVAAAALAGRERSPAGSRPRADIWGGLALAAMVAISALPARALHGLAFPVADALGIGRLLSVGGEPGAAEGLAIVMVGAAALAFLVGPGRAGSGGAGGLRSLRGGSITRWTVWWASSAGAPTGRSAEEARRSDRVSRRWAMAAGVLIAASVGIALRVYVAASARGFL